MLKCARHANEDQLELDALIDDVTAGADDDTACVAAFFEAITKSLKLPVLANTLGQTVQLEQTDYRSTRRGIVAVIMVDGRSHRVALLDMLIGGKSKGAKLVRAYQQWADAETAPAKATSAQTTEHRHNDGLIEAAVLAVGPNSAQLRLLDSDDQVTFRGNVLKLVPGHIATITRKKGRTMEHWAEKYQAKHKNRELSGAIASVRVDIPALKLKPLDLREYGPMPADDGEPYPHPLRELWKKVTAKSRAACEMEQVVPGREEADWDADPIGDALDLRGRGEPDRAEKRLMDLLQTDLRCIDAHAHLGNWAFHEGLDDWLKKAVAHYQVGIGIVEQALGSDFDGMLPWLMIDNRPFLRCMHGLGLAYWRLGQRESALHTFERICILNPMDNTGARFCWHSVRNGEQWEEQETD